MAKLVQNLQTYACKLPCPAVEFHSMLSKGSFRSSQEAIRLYAAAINLDSGLSPNLHCAGFEDVPKYAKIPCILHFRMLEPNKQDLQSLQAQASLLRKAFRLQHL